MRPLKRTYILGGALLGAIFLGLGSVLQFTVAGKGSFPFKGVIPAIVIGGALGALFGYLFREKALFVRDKVEERQVTEPGPAREALQRSEKNLRQILESSMTAIAIHQDDRIVYKNPAYEELTGPLPGLFQMTNFEHIYPDDVDVVRSFHDSLDNKDVKNGDVEFRFWPLDGSGGRLRMKWVHCRGTRILYNGEEVLLFNFMDITGIRELDGLMSRQEKMTSLGRVAATITHEIRNALSSINIYLHTLEKIYERKTGRGKEKEILEQIKRSSDQIESVVKTVKDFARPGAPKLELSDINECVNEAVDMCAKTLRKNRIKIEKLPDQGLSQCYLDRRQIQRVIVNLILNAADALQSVDRDIKRIEIASFKEDENIAVRVSDNGPGIPLHLRGMIFEPFFSSKDDSTGIGLTICQQIIRDHGGLIYVRDSGSGGAEFVIELPERNSTEV